ncbi:hypothetical protein B0W48_06105 [Pseudoalteromonas aliena]|uniref:Uncharacterized protein n=1 Tax=Pseudoalteromonas aliena TaxID=247523 RepID=A0A1Q2GWE1_9GAMM|nr:hypothetical protein [Pseudoalteromonas aliena]AQP99412.1 hypothetical protein B0W48_06105 [Pseudoalteromonas aliena]
MKLFKKALLATAVFGAMGAQAATISSTPLKLSAEGVALKVAPTAGTLTFDVVVDKDHASASTITLSFDKNVDLFDGTTALAGGAVTQGVGAGTAFAGDVGFNYGTGSFTFDDVVIKNGDASKGETDSITFKVNLGNPLTADSAFRVVLGAHGFGGTPNDRVRVSGESSVSYVSNKADKSLIETGTGIIATEVSQFEFKVDTKLDGLITRDDLTSFTVGNDTAVKTDALKYTFVNDESLGLALTGTVSRINFAGNFKGVVGTAATAVLSGESTAAVANTGAAIGVLTLPVNTSSVVNAVLDTVTMTTPGTRIKDTYTNTVDFVNGATSVVDIPVTGNVDASVTVVSVSNAGVTLPTNGYVAFSGVEAGKWAVDATIINIPYLPINAANTSTFVHFANETDNEVDVIVTAIDNNGVEYGPMNLGYKLPANTVKKFSETDMNTFFSLNGASTKLSVTFNVDADKGDVTAYAVSQNDKGRTEVSTSQQRGN